MCLVFVAWRAHARHRLIIAANRDEAHARACAPASFWDDMPSVLAGRDLEGGGAWLGLGRGGRFAAITNFRAPEPALAGAPSRGGLVAGFLGGAHTPDEHAARVSAGAARYNGFNLVVGDPGSFAWCSNRGASPRALAAGLHGISNGPLGADWPKVATGKVAMTRLLAAPAVDAESLLALLADRAVPPDDALPDTGVGLARERELAPRFLLGERYGTRCSTVILVDHDGRVRFRERSFDAAGGVIGEVDLAFLVDVARIRE